LGQITGALTLEDFSPAIQKQMTIQQQKRQIEVTFLFPVALSKCTMEILLRDLRKKFQSGDWNPLRCKLDDIKRHFAEQRGDLGRRKISFYDFDCLYRRAACETITETWKETRAKEKGVAFPSAVNAETTIREGLFFSCLYSFSHSIFLIFSLFLLQSLVQPPPTCQSCLRTTRMMTQLSTLMMKLKKLRNRMRTSEGLGRMRQLT